MKNYDEEILLVLSEASRPLDVEKIRIDAGIANWGTCLNHLLTLYLDGRISGLKSSKSWLFWANKRELDERSHPSRARSTHEGSLVQPEGSGENERAARGQDSSHGDKPGFRFLSVRESRC